MSDPATVASPIPPSGGPAAERAARLREDLVHADPLLDCLVEICRLHGQSATRASLSAGLPLAGGRLTLALAERAASRAGMACKLQRRALGDVDTALLPAILLLKGDEACVLLGWDEAGTHARVLLPESGQGAVSFTRSELEARYSGLALFVRPHFRFDARTPPVRPPRSRHWFWSAVLEQRFVYRDVLWAALLINLFALVFPLFAMNVYDRVVPNQAVETLWALAIGVSLVIGADLLMRSLRGRFIDEASARIDVQISATLMERVLGLRMEHRPESVGSMAANLRSFEQVRDFIASSTVTALIDLPFAILFIVLIAWIAPWLVLPVLLSFGVVLLLAWTLQSRLHALAEQTYRASAMRNATLVESLTGLETIKTQAAESVIQGRWERANAHLAGLNVRMRRLSASALHSTASVQQFVSVVLILIGVYLIGERELTMGGLIACTMLASRALGPAGQIVGLLMQYQGARTALESLNKIMEQPVERPAGAHYVQRREFKGEIEFRGVKFAYPNRQDNALDGVSFKIAPGDRVALIGRVGSGKSTIEKLILGLYRPTEGAVLIDGIDVRQLDPADIRRNVACVSQDVTLFYGSLRENITLGLPYADDSTLLAAAEVAGLLEFVNRHPMGFDMMWVSAANRSRAGSARPWASPAPCCTTRPCCCWTSPPARWTSPARRTSTPRSAALPRARPWCW
jgi:ATP-binding cassette, subfamily C, bacterial LapB